MAENRINFFYQIDFLYHREQILNQNLGSFEYLFEPRNCESLDLIRKYSIKPPIFCNQSVN